MNDQPNNDAIDLPSKVFALAERVTLIEAKLDRLMIQLSSVIPFLDTQRSQPFDESRTETGMGAIVRGERSQFA
jgi:hypothetical protein